MLRAWLTDGTRIEADTTAELMELLRAIHAKPSAPQRENTAAVCACGTILPLSGKTGPLRTVCDACARKRELETNRARHQRLRSARQATDGPPPVFTCPDCGERFQKENRMGPARKRCLKCTAKRNKESVRRSMAAARAGGITAVTKIKPAASVTLVSREDMETDASLARIRRAARSKNT